MGAAKIGLWTHEDRLRTGDNVCMEDAAVAEINADFETESDEEHRVRRWRLDQFVGLGFDHAMAALMTALPVDLALARRLVAAGCPLETAARILL